MILLIDNYDSFTYNLYQLVGSLDSNIKVIKNDELTVYEIEKLHPRAIILSPGPGNPDDAGVSLEVVTKLQDKIPMLGICMGLQVMIQALGGKIIPAKKLMHGKTSNLKLNNKSLLFNNCHPSGKVARYHSLIGDNKSLPQEFKITAVDEDNEIMAAEIAAKKLYGVQFHPESILTDTELGKQIINNFLTSF
ncbi:aminodeoxychorismate/anthranilate synthase component II [Fructilactobacillus vespulae]|uniref:anthranilate synthase component II n=1 Tax=Fructilactobacillus vespulae TaxID=1249630 RepID=UPI0039B551B7